VEDRPLAAARRDYRHARKRLARLSQHALEWTPLERPLRPPSATGISSILVQNLSYTLRDVIHVIDASGQKEEDKDRNEGPPSEPNPIAVGKEDLDKRCGLRHAACSHAKYLER